MDKLADLLRQGADKLVNLPTTAQRFVTNPQAFVELLTGKNALPRETGFAAGATGLPPVEGTVLDPSYQSYMQGYQQGEPVGYAAMAVPAAVPVAKALAPKAGQMAENYMVNQGFMPSIVAYHGTPHTIKGKFDISKVGTGEGAQAYGHGMYFAESKDLADVYRKKLTNEAGNPVKSPNDSIQLQIGRLDDQIKQLQQSNDPNAGPMIKAYQSRIDEINKAGNLYKVDIPDEYIPNMLDWDKPLIEQTPEVQAAIQKLGDKFRPLDEMEAKNVFGERLYRRIENSLGKNYGNKANPEASAMLNKVGIKGIKYKDAGSRNGGEATYNYVVFDPAEVKILEQNSKPMTRKEIIEQELEKVSK